MTKKHDNSSIDKKFWKHASITFFICMSLLAGAYYMKFNGMTPKWVESAQE